MSQRTSIGKTVNKLRQSESPICDKANQLVTKWKDTATAEKSNTKTVKATDKTQSNQIEGHSVSPLKRKKDSSVYSPLNTASSVAPDEKKKNASFEDMLLMPLYDMDKKKKKKKKDEGSPLKVCSYIYV